MDDLFLPYSCLNDEELASMLECPSRDISHDYKNVYFESIWPFDVRMEEFNVLQSLYFDLADRPSVPPTGSDEFALYIMSFNIRSVSRILEVLVADIFHLPAVIFGLCNTRIISDRQLLNYLNRFKYF